MMHNVYPTDAPKVDLYERNQFRTLNELQRLYKQTAADFRQHLQASHPDEDLKNSKTKEYQERLKELDNSVQAYITAAIRGER